MEITSLSIYIPALLKLVPFEVKIILPVLVAVPCFEDTVIAEVCADDKLIVPELVMVSVSDEATDEVDDGDFVFITLCFTVKVNLSAKVAASLEELEPEELDDEDSSFIVAS